MNGDKVTAGIDFSVPDAKRTQLLEARYIELLEKRIATLERLTEEQKTIIDRVLSSKLFQVE